jgi:hypothetical protein
VRVVDATFAMPLSLPATKLGTGTGAVGDATTKATLPVPAASGTAFTLEAKKVGAEGNQISAIVTPAGDGTSFTLAVSWTSKVTGVKASDLPTLDTKLAPLAWEVTVAKPASGFAQPQAGTVTLSGGIDPATASQNIVAGA